MAEYIKPKCPQCGHYNVRYRNRLDFKDAPYHCNICGHNWAEKPAAG